MCFLKRNITKIYLVLGSLAFFMALVDLFSVINVGIKGSLVVSMLIEAIVLLVIYFFTVVLILQNKLNKQVTLFLTSVLYLVLLVMGLWVYIDNEVIVAFIPYLLIYAGICILCFVNYGDNKKNKVLDILLIVHFLAILLTFNISAINISVLAFILIPILSLYTNTNIEVENKKIEVDEEKDEENF